MRYDAKAEGFVPWLPSTWPSAPSSWDPDFKTVLRRIFDETVTGELRNVVADVQKVTGGHLAFRGHVIAVGLMCAIDAAASYAYRDVDTETCSTCRRGDKPGPRFKRFIREHFPAEWRSFDEAIYKLYRNSLVHSWHLFKVAMTADAGAPREANGEVVIGLIGLMLALEHGIADFLTRLDQDPELQRSAIARYSELTGTAVR